MSVATLVGADDPDRAPVAEPLVLSERDIRILALLVGEAVERDTDPRMTAERRHLYERLCASIGA
jgi:hypothetical protein